MSRFPDPDIDPALTAEAKLVVDQAFGEIRKVIDEGMQKFEDQSQEEIAKLGAETKAELDRLIREDGERQRIIGEAIKMTNLAALRLTELDSDQRNVIENLKSLTQTVETELREREERLRGLGEKAVALSVAAAKRLAGVP